MNLLFITKYLAGDIGSLIKEIKIALIPFFIVLIAMILDLIFGIQKAISLGEARTSYGLRRTGKKFIEYYSMMILAFTVDVLASIVDSYNLPYITFAIGAYLVITEGLSIREKASEKERRKQNKDISMLLSILENRGDIFKTITDIAKKEIDKSNELLDKKQEVKENELD